MRKAMAAAVMALSIVAGAVGGAAAEGAMKLFKVVSPKDEVVIGLTEAELAGFGAGGDLDVLAARLGSAGQITAWQYAVRKAANGDLQQAPSRRISVFAAGVVRIEPYTTPLPVIPPAE